MDQVVGSVERVTSIVGEIDLASQEQRTGISEIGNAIGLMDNATQQNAALVEQAAAAARRCRNRPHTWRSWWAASSSTAMTSPATQRLAARRRWRREPCWR